MIFHSEVMANVGRFCRSNYKKPRTLHFNIQSQFI